MDSLGKILIALGAGIAVLEELESDKANAPEKVLSRSERLKMSREEIRQYKVSNTSSMFDKGALEKRLDEVKSKIVPK